MKGELCSSVCFPWNINWNRKSLTQASTLELSQMQSTACVKYIFLIMNHNITTTYALSSDPPMPLVGIDLELHL